MAHRVFDLTQETTTDIGGTGALTLAGNTPGMFPFAAGGIADGDTFWGLVQHSTAQEVELTLCTWHAGGTITRASVPEKSTTGSKINFSSGPKYVSCVAPSSKSAIMDANGNFIFPGAVVTKAVRETVVALQIVAGAVALDVLLGGVFTLPVNANITLIDIQNETTGYGHSFTVEFTANGTGYAQVWPWVWVNGTPVLTTTNGKRDLAVVWSIDGINFFAAMVAQNY